MSTNPEISIGNDLSDESWWVAGQNMSIGVLEEGQLLELTIGIPIPSPFAPTDPSKSSGWIKGVLLYDTKELVEQYESYFEQGKLSIFAEENVAIASGGQARLFNDDTILSNVERAALAAVKEEDAILTEGEDISTVKGFIIDEESGMVAGYYRQGTDEMLEAMPKEWMELELETTPNATSIL